MAVSKQDVLSFIAEHVTDKRKNVPRKDIIAHLGEEAGAVIDQLKKDGTIKGNRGRTGGLSMIDSTAASVEPTVEAAETPAVESDSTAAQFAALLAKMEQDEAQSNNEPEAAAAPF